jgi:hypothetical protein
MQGQALFVGSSKDDGIIHQGGLLQRDVRPKGVVEARYE